MIMLCEYHIPSKVSPNYRPHDKVMKASFKEDKDSCKISVPGRKEFSKGWQKVKSQTA